MSYSNICKKFSNIKIRSYSKTFASVRKVPQVKRMRANSFRCGIYSGNFTANFPQKPLAYPTTPWYNTKVFVRETVVSRHPRRSADGSDRIMNALKGREDVNYGFSKSVK